MQAGPKPGRRPCWAWSGSGERTREGAGERGAKEGRERDESTATQAEASFIAGSVGESVAALDALRTSAREPSRERSTDLRQLARNQRLNLQPALRTNSDTNTLQSPPFPWSPRPYGHLSPPTRATWRTLQSEAKACRPSSLLPSTSPLHPPRRPSCLVTPLLRTSTTTSRPRTMPPLPVRRPI